MALNWRSFLYLTFSHVASSTLVVAYNWDAINRRLHRYTTDLILSYFFWSLFLLIAILLTRRLKNGLLAGFFMPYFASILSYSFVTETGILKQLIRSNGIDYLSLLAIILTAPYLMIWGPIISTTSVLTIWLLNRNARISIK